MNILNLTLEQIINTSGDSEFISCKFEEGKLYITLYHDELDTNIQFTIKTSSLHFPFKENHKDDTASRTCYIQITELTTTLTLTNSIYTPSTNFGTFKKECDTGLYLAYGKTKKEVQYLFSLKNNTTILACPFKDYEDVEYEEFD